MRVATLACAAVVLVLLVVIVAGSTKPNRAGANSLLPPVAYTGAPGDVGTCITCHLGNIGTPDGGIVAVPSTGVTEYTPGLTDTIGVILSDPGQARWGFELTVLKNSDNSMAGSLANLQDPPVLTGTQSSGGKTYISHTSNGATSAFDGDDGTYWGIPNGAGWLFEWTAPPPGSGPVTIYVAGVASDSSQTANSYDYTYTYSLTLQEAGTTPVTSTTWGKIKKRYR